MKKFLTDLSRRKFLRYASAGAALATFPQRFSPAQIPPVTGQPMARKAEQAVVPPSQDGWFMPSEQAPHERCWMAWPARKDVWNEKLGDVRKDIARLARTIAEYEPVTMLAEPDQSAEAARLCGSTVSVLTVGVDDMWFRDSGPVFLTNGKGGIAGSTFNFNAWGNKQTHARDAKIAENLLAHLDIPRFHAPFVTEGGAIETDGEGTLLVTEPSIHNKNRNPGKTREELGEYLCGWLGVQKVLWMPYSHPDYWTDGHVDGVARFVRPGVVLVDQGIPEVVQFLAQATDAKGRKIKLIELPRPAKIHSNSAYFCNCYLNFYFANGAVIMPQFGDSDADARAREIVGEAYPQRKLVPIELDTIASGGGLIHCVTQQEPAV